MAPRPILLRFLGDTSSLTRSFQLGSMQAATFGTAISGVNAKLAAMGGSLTSIGVGLERNLTVPIGVASGYSTILATNFEKSLTKIETLAGESRVQVQAWTGDLKTLAVALGKSPQELADALYFIASSGIDASNALSLLTVSGKASAVGMGATKVTADALTSAINAYGIENLSAARAGDILVAAVRDGKGEAEDFARSIGRVIAPAQNLGVSFDEVAAAMSSMTLVGLSADEAATALRQTFMTFMNPTAEKVKALRELGLSLDDVRKSMKEKGLLATFKDLREKIGDNDEALTSIFGNVRALNGFLIMTGANVGRTEQVFNNLAGASGDLDRAFERTTENSAFKFDQSLGRIKVVGMEVGGEILPQLTKTVGDLSTKFLNAWNGMSDSQQQFAVKAALAAAAAGPLLHIAGNLVSVMSLIAKHPVILAIALVAAGLYLAYTRCETFRNIVDATARVLSGTFLAVFEWLKENGPIIWDSVTEAATNATSAISNAFTTAREAIQPFIDWISQYVSPVFVEAFGLITDIIERLAPIVERAFDIFKKVVGDLTPYIKWQFEFIVELIQQFYNVAKPIIELIAFVLWNSIQTAFNVIKPIVEGFLLIIRGFIEILRGIVQGDFSQVWEGVKHILEGYWHAISGAATAAFDSIVNLVTGLPGRLLNVLQALGNAGWELGKKFVSGLIDGIKGLAGAALDIAGGLGDALFDAFKAAWNKIVDLMNHTTDGFDIDMPGPIPNIGLPNGMWNFMKLANGAVVDHPTFAMIGEAGPEAVIPLNRPRRAAQIMEEAGLMGGGTSFVVNQNITATDPREAARASTDEWFWAWKTAGV